LFLEEIMTERLVFKNRAAFRRWLERHHGRPAGLWLVFGKNNLLETLNPEQALEEALCFGWIDGLIKSVDDTRYIKYFSPRRSKSNWSEKNKRTAESLIQSGRMTAPGMKAIEKAKQDGTWDRRPRPVTTPEEIEDFARLVAASPEAAANFNKMPQSVKKQFTGFYLEAKRESTRRQRLEKLMELLKQNKRPM
jgi:uncharacterized protein YdeI (YjbR/CyaY-like superfamily)